MIPGLYIEVPHDGGSHVVTVSSPGVNFKFWHAEPGQITHTRTTVLLDYSGGPYALGSLVYLNTPSIPEAIIAFDTGFEPPANQPCIIVLETWTSPQSLHVLGSLRAYRAFIDVA